MDTGRILCSLFLLLFAFSPSICAETAVWIVEKNGNKLFIGGTIHMLIASDYPLPGAYEKAYTRSAKIVLETDMQKLQSAEFQTTMMRELSYTDGVNLRQVVNRQTYLALEQFFTQRGIPMVNIIGFKPGMVATMMTMVELQRLGLLGAGVDAYYNAKAIKDEKVLGQLESVETQLNFIANMGVGQEDELLAYSLEDIVKLPNLLQTMKDAWRQGDMKSLETIGITPFKAEFPAIYQALLVDRNNAWMPKIEAMLKTSEVEFVLVGALHLAGADGLLSQLISRDYSVRKMLTQ
jgi:uncharacterized protein YbaP (TraB family)